ncbi:hypothetical protein [Sorangium sp. So ce128]|uniref:hypothetical protein n=1 Tax=Sorangium sp. So ce128 TaxID=3133281 RepID=UPI003F637B43
MPPSSAFQDDASVNESWLAAGTLFAGGATVITATVMIFMSMPQSCRTEDGGGVRVEIRPAASPAAAMVSARFVF